MIETSTLRHVLDYEPKTGLFKWRFSYHAKVQLGRIAGSINRGYVIIKINGQKHSAHRLAWQYMHGTPAKGMVDHINRSRADNRISNLRDTGYLENSRNRNPTLFRLSNYGDPLAAYQAFCKAAQLRFGDKAVFSPPLEQAVGLGIGDPTRKC